MFRINTVAKCFKSKFAAVFSFVVGFLVCLCVGVAEIQANAVGSKAESTASITGIYARLSEEITMRYVASLPDGYSSPEMNFSTPEKAITTCEYEKTVDGEFVFSYAVNPQNFRELVKAELYAANPSGEKEKIDEKSYSLEKYCQGLIKSNDFKGLSGKKAYATKILATSVLDYGNAAENLVYDSGEKQPKNSQYTIKYDGERLPQTKQAVQSDEVVWKSAGVSFSSGVSVYFTARVKRTENTLSCSITNDGDEICDRERTIEVDNGDFIDIKFYTKNISPVCFSNELTAQILSDNANYGGKCKYNVNSCIFNNMKNERLGNFVDCVFRYGKAAVLYEHIDEENTVFSGSGSILAGDYTLKTTCNGYEYNVVLPEATADCYDFSVTDEQNGIGKYILKRGEYYEAFGEIASEEITLNNAVIIGKKVFYTPDTEQLVDYSGGTATIATNPENGGILLTLNKFSTEEKISVYGDKECKIQLIGTNSICHGSGQESLYSTVKLAFCGNGSLKTGVIEAKEVSFDSSVLNIYTGEKRSGEYALKADNVSSTGSIEITTKNDCGILAGNTTINDGGLTIIGATTGVKGGGLTVGADSIVYIECKNGIELTGKLSVSEKAGITVKADEIGIKAIKTGLSGTLDISTKTGTAIEISQPDKNTFKKTCAVTLTNCNKAKIGVKVGACDELIVRGTFSIIDYKYYFYTDNANNDSVLTFDNFMLDGEEMPEISGLTKGFHIE